MCATRTILRRFTRRFPSNPRVLDLVAVLTPLQPPPVCYIDDETGDILCVTNRGSKLGMLSLVVRMTADDLRIVHQEGGGPLFVELFQISDFTEPARWVDACGKEEAPRRQSTWKFILSRFRAQRAGLLSVSDIQVEELMQQFSRVRAYEVPQT